MDQERGGRGRCKGEAQGGKGEARGRHRRQGRLGRGRAQVLPRPCGEHLVVKILQ